MLVEASFDRSCHLWYVEDWQVFHYFATGSDCEWHWTVELLGGDDMVRVVVRWLAWTMLFLALWGCAGAPAEEPAPAADVPSEAPAEPSEAPAADVGEVASAPAGKVPTVEAHAPEATVSDEELLGGAGASFSSRPSREALRQQHMQQLAAEQFSNLIPLWQLLQHVISAVATSQAQLDVLGQQTQQITSTLERLPGAIMDGVDRIVTEQRRAHSAQMDRVLRLVQMEMSRSFQRSPGTPGRAPATPGMGSAPGTPFGLVALNEGGEARATRRARCGVCSGCRTKTAVKERRPPCINWIPVEPLERDERGRFKRAADTTTESAAEAAEAPKRAVQFPKRPKKEKKDKKKKKEEDDLWDEASGVCDSPEPLGKGPEDPPGDGGAG
ncbi:hypothetical protein AK812_SmicGene44618, partial [Symbiodinium microadriaticum]